MLELLSGIIDFFIMIVLSSVLLQAVKTANSKNIINLVASVLIVLI